MDRAQAVIIKFISFKQFCEEVARVRNEGKVKSVIVDNPYADNKDHFKEWLRACGYVANVVDGEVEVIL